MAADAETRARILQAVPQQAPFRFIDEILELDEKRIRGAYRFREDEFFYKGHFPGRPITPGVILIETMAQAGVVALGIYITMLERKITLEDINKSLTVFTYVETVDFADKVMPGERVIVEAEKIYFRRENIKARAQMFHENGKLVCNGILAGMGIR